MTPAPGRTVANATARRLAVWAIGSGFAVLLGVATASAFAAFDRPFLSFFVDPYGEYSLVHLPNWAVPSSVGRSDWVKSLEGSPIVSHRAAGVSRAILERLGDLASTQHSVLVAVDGPTGLRTFATPIRRIGWPEVWAFFVMYAVVASFTVISALVVLQIAERRAARTAYLVWATSTAGFLVTFFDYHTVTWLHPVFTASTIGMVAGPLLLAIAFPELPDKGSRRLWHIAFVLTTILAGLAALYAIGAASVGQNARPIRHLVNWLLAPSALLLGIALVVRLKWASEGERSQIRSAIWVLAGAPVMIAFVQAITLMTGIDLLHLVLPVLLASFPLAIGYALVRRNILGASTVVRQRVLACPVIVVALLAATLVWVFLSQSDLLRSQPQAVALAIAVCVFVAVGTIGWKAGKAILFGTSRRLQPTLERLGDELSSVREPGAIRRAVEEITAHWLPTRVVRVVDGARLEELHWPANYLERLGRGERVWTEGDGWERELLVPMKSLGTLRAVLSVALKRESALFTDQDLALLDTMASLGAIALHNAEIVLEVEELRRLQLSAARDEKKLALGILGAEVAHEIAYPLNYLRYLLQQAAEQRALSQEDVEIGGEEVERLSRMLAGLRKLTPPQPRLESVCLGHSISRALHLSRDLIAEKRIEVHVDVPGDFSVQAEADPLVQLFSNLIRNAAQAVPVGGMLGVELMRDSGSPTIEIWDTGPGIPEELRKTIFAPWVTTREGGTGLGLAVAQRIVRAFGWTISVHGTPEKTIFRLHLGSTPAKGYQAQASTTDGEEVT